MKAELTSNERFYTGRNMVKNKKIKKLKSYPGPIDQIAADFNVFFFNSKMKIVSQEAIGNFGQLLLYKLSIDCNAQTPLQLLEIN